jgi:cell division transport system ATP-binding protein
MLYREEKPTKGEIIIGGINVEKLRNRKVYKLRRKLGIVFQDFKLLPKLTIYENVAFPLEILGLQKKEIRQKTLQALDLVGLKHKVKDYPDQLSGGEQQRIAIARAIVNEPKLLLCDEPTGNLDPKTSFEILRVLEEINKLGTTVIMATHDKAMVDHFKKRVIVIENGGIIKDYEKGKYEDEVD